MITVDILYSHILCVNVFLPQLFIYSVSFSVTVLTIRSIIDPSNLYLLIFLMICISLGQTINVPAKIFLQIRCT